MDEDARQSTIKVKKAKRPKKKDDTASSLVEEEDPVLCRHCGARCSVNYQLQKQVFRWRCRACRNWMHTVEDPVGEKLSFFF